MSLIEPLFHVLNDAGIRYVDSIPDLIHLKRLAGRPLDLTDIAHLEAILKTRQRGEND